MDDLGYERFAPKTGNEPTAENKSSTVLEHKEESLNEGEVVNQELKTEETPKSVETSDKLIGNADNILPADVNAKTETENKLNPDTPINKETKVNTTIPVKGKKTVKSKSFLKTLLSTYILRALPL